MVRLVDFRRRHYWILPPFQFQYGAIGGIVIERDLELEIISIPVWCDWWLRMLFISIAEILFQFQYGAIGG